MISVLDLSRHNKRQGNAQEVEDREGDEYAACDVDDASRGGHELRGAGGLEQARLVRGVTLGCPAAAGRRVQLALRVLVVTRAVPATAAKVLLVKVPLGGHGRVGLELVGERARHPAREFVAVLDAQADHARDELYDEDDEHDARVEEEEAVVVAHRRVQAECAEEHDRYAEYDANHRTFTYIN